MGWVDPWVGLGRVGSRFCSFLWVGSTIAKVLKFERIILMHLKHGLDKIWLHQAVKFDFMADLTGTGN